MNGVMKGHVTWAFVLRVGMHVYPGRREGEAEKEIEVRVRGGIDGDGDGGGEGGRQREVEQRKETAK